MTEPRWCYRAVLPWPSPKLNPNQATFWMQKAMAIKRLRRAVAEVVASLPRVTVPPGPLLVELTFHPPDTRKRDLDNACASAKAIMDGLCWGIGLPTDPVPPYEGLGGLGIDDHRFDELRVVRGAKIERGAVVARIGAILGAGLMD